jgi:diaminohydroxyphosphoribosylaminopyrimidine deaminase / 5-amino-6-(5-phosphoribosylamino)uracil reductase
MNATSHERYMYRCLQLAQLGVGNVAPNPMVGAVLVHDDKIIGEGYHRKYGEPHAEVNCINSVSPDKQELISQSTLYVSLEPCAHFGKTPPCADLIVHMKIPRVVIGCRDPFAQVDGKGIEKLSSAGVEVVSGILEKECRELNKRFFTFHTYHRPYIMLKWAQTADSKLGYSSSLGNSPLPVSRLFITNAFTNRLVHKWRSEQMAILIGTHTAIQDDPSLNTRLWPGNHPVRMVIDKQLTLPSGLKLFDGSIPTIVFNERKNTIENLKAVRQEPGVHYYQVTNSVSLVQQIMNALYHMEIQSLLVEGGSVLLQSFIEEDMWDEARVITNENLFLGEGLAAPVLRKGTLIFSEGIASDTIRTYQHIKLNEPL